MREPTYNSAIYLRLSRDDELHGDSSSIKTQRQMLRKYAADHNINIYDEYIDDGWSGTNFDRPDFKHMIGDIEDGKINCVIVKDTAFTKLMTSIKQRCFAFFDKFGGNKTKTYIVSPSAWLGLSDSLISEKNPFSSAPSRSI